jgi:hypothetical protein
VEADGQYWIVRCVSVVAAHQPELAEVRQAVALRLLDERRQAATSALLSRLRREIPITFNRDALRELGLEPPN